MSAKPFCVPGFLAPQRSHTEGRSHGDGSERSVPPWLHVRLPPQMLCGKGALCSLVIGKTPPVAPFQPWAAIFSKDKR